MAKGPYELDAASTSTHPHLTVGQVARRAGLSSRAVRFYEAEGLLRRARRSVSGYRLYDAQDVDLLRLIARLRAIGFGVNDIREVVRLREHGAPPPDRVIELLGRKVAEIDRQLSSLHETRGNLTDLLHRTHAGGEHVRLCHLVGASTAED